MASQQIKCRQGFTATQRMMILERIFFGWRRNFVLNLQWIFGRKLSFGAIWVSVQTREPSMFFKLELRLTPDALLGIAFGQWERMASILATMINLGLKNMIGSDDREWNIGVVVQLINNTFWLMLKKNSIILRDW